MELIIICILNFLFYKYFWDKIELINIKGNLFGFDVYLEK